MQGVETSNSSHWIGPVNVLSTQKVGGEGGAARLKIEQAGGRSLRELPSYFTSRMPRAEGRGREQEPDGRGK